MAKRIDFNNLPYRPTLSNSKSKTEELFNLINNMDTQEIKQFSIISSINLNVDEDSTGDNLIHKVLTSNNLLKKGKSVLFITMFCCSEKLLTGGIKCFIIMS
jgi:hypothetical protein